MASPRPAAASYAGPTAVLVVDDHAVFAESLAFVLGGDHRFGRVDVAPTAARARHLLREGPYDLAVIDVQLGDGSGLELLDELRDVRPAPRAFVLTAHPRPDVVERARASGAVAVLTKGAGLEELLDALASPGEPTGAWPAHPQAGLLSPRELQVVQLLAEGQDVRGVAQALGLSVHTVRDYVKSLLEKLGAHHQLGAVVAAHRAGLITLGVD